MACRIAVENEKEDMLFIKYFFLSFKAVNTKEFLPFKLNKWTHWSIKRQKTIVPIL